MDGWRSRKPEVERTWPVYCESNHLVTAAEYLSRGAKSTVGEASEERSPEEHREEHGHSSPPLAPGPSWPLSEIGTRMGADGR